MRLDRISLLILLSTVAASFATGNLSLAVKVDNFGWMPGDQKIAVFTQNPGASVEIRSVVDDSVAWTVGSVVNAGQDEDSGDLCWTADFSGLTIEGSYYVYSPSLNIRSYEFDINPWVFNKVGEALIKSYYYQRCNFAKADPYSGPWQDGVCHNSDFAMTRWTGGDLAGHGYTPGQPDYGTLDLHGGWHDAGDYQKTPHWDRGVIPLLWAYEVNPNVWKDGQLNIPESGNGIPDILDEISWELDFYVRCQRPDGHFLSSASGHDGSIASPPSANNEIRGYVDAWPDEATARSVAKLAHASLLYRNIGQTAIADKYEAAATNGWKWLTGRSLTGNNNKLKCVAAAALWRMNPDSLVTVSTSAKNFVERWSGGWTSVQPSDVDFVNAIWYYLASPGTSAGVVNSMRSAVLGNTWQGILNQTFDSIGEYGGLRGDKDNGWDWSWGSNKNHGSYGFNLMMSLRYGIKGTYSSNQIRNQAERYLHYLLGRNTLSMVYLSSMHLYGGEHSVFQFFHSWFGNQPYTPSDGGYNPFFNGKPVSVNEPFYPYCPADNQTSAYGPAPGILVGGPNIYYSGNYVPPANTVYPARAYRDWSVGCDWSGGACQSSSWEVTENSLGYSGPVTALASFFMGLDDPNAASAISLVLVTNIPQVDLKWTKYPQGNVLTYKVELRSTGLATTTNSVASATNWTHSLPDRGRTYRYQILVYTNGLFVRRAQTVTFEIPRLAISGLSLEYDKDKQKVLLEWDALGVPSTVYSVERTLDDGTGYTNRLVGAVLSFEDNLVLPGRTYRYRITGQTNSLVIAESSEAVISLPGLSEGFQIRGNFIRPVKCPQECSAEIRVNILAVVDSVSVDIYDAEGTRVRRYSETNPSEGIWIRSWDGDDDHGKPVPSGVYLAVIRVGEAAPGRAKIMVVR